MILLEKDLTIIDTSYAKKILERTSYFSLIGGYKSLFKNPSTGKYKYNVTFEELVAFYYFDEELRTLFLKYILHIERHIKSMFSYYFCEKYGENLYNLTAGGNIIASDAEIEQGALETSNVNVVNEMVNMITIQRAYEAGQKVITSIDETLDKAVNNVGRV